MSTSRSVPRVGAPDPERRNSPIFDSSTADDLSLDRELESGFCYFNDERFELGAFVCCGDELLRCEDRGVWVREGTCEK